ncbi:hypothetical protein N7478_011467 [Penicillium angulare]|uniref:uncharacterized protein n=1 Tax=Penicillium angulare TaxID=116970 RepID=UPI00254176C5|nr:uncharacterized protein N7478_011467 [Penicillium angulare]KAJ5263862.1 hypothetical protein N7478_011467 [Penicillium angulare]
MLLLGALVLLLQGSVAQRDSDLSSFVTLPEVRALKFEVHHVDRDRQLPGYWFVAPYGQINPEASTHRYQQYQVGPYIYDNDGMLIWAGSPLYDNRNVFDFKANWNIDDQPHLSFILQHTDVEKGSGMILNNKYELEHEVAVTNDLDAFNMHEFNILDGGKTALACSYIPSLVSFASFGRPEEEGWVQAGGFVELDIESSEVVHEWDSHNEISVFESIKVQPWDSPSGAPGSDYVHINAVDKNDAGDYIISMRFTNTIYGISGSEGKIMWRLGGLESNFDMDFIFHKQHDVKFISSNETHHVISLMNNASDEGEADESISAALYIELDMTTMVARVIRRIERPDGGLTRLRGNVQSLPNDNTFVGWSERGYHSEHAPNGDLLMWAKFSSDRFSSYRSYKFDWIGRPNTTPDLVSSVYGTNREDVLTIIHVSWNGATDIAGWNFFARAHESGENIFIGYTSKSDFETMYLADGFMDWVSVEAIDGEGNVLSTSGLQRTNIPENWAAVGFELEGSSPSPDDPSLLYLPNGEVEEPVDDGTSSSNLKSQDQIYADTKEVAKSVYKVYAILHAVEALAILVLVGSCVAGVVFGVKRILRRRRHLSSYKNVPTEEGNDEVEESSLPAEQIPLRRNSDG